MFLLITVFSVAQNLVPNPSFEDTVSCPSGPSQFNKTMVWVNPTTASPDYFNSCAGYASGMNVPNTGFGYQPPLSGVAYAGFYAYNTVHVDYKEYVQAKLLDTLLLNHRYLVSFHVNLSNNSQYSVSSVGAYFSSTPIVSTSSLVLNYTPQIQNQASIQLSDSVNWMLISDTLVSNGTEQYVTIGNFKTDAQSDTVYLGWFSSNNIAYYYIDDVSVIDVIDLAVSENQVNIKKINIYPNPTNEKVYVSGFSVIDKLVSENLS